MSRTFITLFFILAISTAGVLSNTTVCSCGRNEVWSECTAHCKSTCVDPYPPCPKICVPGCICKPGYRADSKRRCVPADCCDWDLEVSE